MLVAFLSAPRFAYADYLKLVINRTLGREFTDAVKSVTKDLCEEAKEQLQNWIASQAVELQESIYRV